MSKARPHRRRLYKTLVTVAVISEKPLELEGMDRRDKLMRLGHSITDGDNVGVISMGPSYALSGINLVREIEEMGSEPGFFQLDEKGNDLKKGA